jgi:hypothetical protein
LTGRPYTTPVSAEHSQRFLSPYTFAKALDDSSAFGDLDFVNPKLSVAFDE